MAIRTSKVPSGVRPNVKRLAAEVVRLFPAIPNVWGATNTPDHNNLRCVDYMVTNTKLSPEERRKLGNDIAAWHIEQHRLGLIDLEFMAWAGRNWGMGQGKASERWTPRPQGDHYDHVHVQTSNRYNGPAVEHVMYANRNGTPGFKAGRAKNPLRRPLGFRITGRWAYRSDGKYLVTKFNTWYPEDSLVATRPAVAK